MCASRTWSHPPKKTEIIETTAVVSSQEKIPCWCHKWAVSYMMDKQTSDPSCGRTLLWNLRTCWFYWFHFNIVLRSTVLLLGYWCEKPIASESGDCEHTSEVKFCGSTHRLRGNTNDKTTMLLCHPLVYLFNFHNKIPLPVPLFQIYGRCAATQMAQNTHKWIYKKLYWNTSLF